MLILDQELLKRDVKGLTAALQESQARKIQLIGDLGSPCSRKAELVTDPGDIQTWIAYSRSVAMAVNNGVESMTVVNVFDKLEKKFTDMMKDKEDLDIYEL